MDRKDYFTQKKRTQLLEIAIFGTKNSVIIDARHPLVHLLLQQLNERHCHHGVEYLKALTQQNFSILKLRKNLTSIQLEFLTYRERKVETFTPIMADVPRERLVLTYRPFFNTGIN